MAALAYERCQLRCYTPFGCRQQHGEQQPQIYRPEYFENRLCSLELTATLVTSNPKRFVFFTVAGGFSYSDQYYYQSTIPVQASECAWDAYSIATLSVGSTFGRLSCTPRQVVSIYMFSG